MKNKKVIVGIIAAVTALAAIVTVVIIYRYQISDFIYSVKNKFCSKKQKFTPEECEDFADI